MRARSATPGDAEAIAAIYNEGIEDGIATFETRLRMADESGSGSTSVFRSSRSRMRRANSSRLRPRRNIVRANAMPGSRNFRCMRPAPLRGQGAGRLAMETLMNAARQAGFWKLVSRVFVENAASRALMHRLGFREVASTNATRNYTRPGATSSSSNGCSVRREFWVFGFWGFVVLGFEGFRIYGFSVRLRIRQLSSLKPKT